jgi:hypothetical protein
VPVRPEDLPAVKDSLVVKVIQTVIQVVVVLLVVEALLEDLLAVRAT